jgi:hypothetical protein
MVNDDGGVRGRKLRLVSADEPIIPRRITKDSIT